jgi:hypothetical protein
VKGANPEALHYESFCIFLTLRLKYTRQQPVLHSSVCGPQVKDQVLYPWNVTLKYAFVYFKEANTSITYPRCPLLINCYLPRNEGVIFYSVFRRILNTVERLLHSLNSSVCIKQFEHRFTDFHEI